ncbi:MAG: hypothetical protein HZB14_05505 [Actinobacteria bacterium]|nr:hypothetical protein [Actinomycetota bacterium]
MAKPRYTLKVRDGARTTRERFDSRDALLAAAGRYAEDMAAAAANKTVKTPLRDFDPIEQVVGRVEIHRKGHRPLLGEHAGIDVRGDGSMEAWSGKLSRSLIEQSPGETVIGALRRGFAG